MRALRFGALLGVLFVSQAAQNIDSGTQETAEYSAKIPFNLDQNTLESFGQLESLEGTHARMQLTRDGVAMLSSYLHHLGMPCGAVVREGFDFLPTESIAEVSPVLSTQDKDKRVQVAVDLFDETRVEANIRVLSDIKTRFHESETGKSVPGILEQKYRAIAGDRTDVEFEQFNHGGLSPQKSLIVRIKGTKAPNEIVVLGSHLDSIVWFSGRAPGADDNASGTATNIEVFKALMDANIRPERTIEIHAYAAEEVGLVGSQDIAQKYQRAGKKVVSMVQFDMNLYSPTGKPKIWFVTNGTSKDLNSHLSNLVGNYQTIEVGFQELRAGTSDHESWTRAGYAAAFPSEHPTNYNKAIHSTNDTLETAHQWDQVKAFGKLGVSYLMHFGGI